MGPSTDTGWIRVSRSCNHACVFCSDAANLTGADVELATVKAELVQLVSEGKRRVVFTGGEPTMARQLPAFIKAAKAAGLTVAMTTNGRLLANDTIAKKLVEWGLSEVRISLHGGKRVTADVVSGAPGAWAAAMNAIRKCSRNGIDVTVQMVVTTETLPGLGFTMHMVMMAGCTRFIVRELQRGEDDEVYDELYVPLSGFSMLNTLWPQAKDDQVRLEVFGFEGGGAVGGDAAQRPVQADIAGLEILRKGIELPVFEAGFSVADVDGRTRDFVTLAEELGGLAAVTEAFRQVGKVVVDLPLCVGGGGLSASNAQFNEVCDNCSQRQECGGLVRPLQRFSSELRALH